MSPLISSLLRTVASAAALLALILGAACGTGLAAEVAPSGPPPEAKGWKATTVVAGLRQPWGMAWLENGSALITTKEGKLHILENGVLRDVPTEGLPPVFTGGQGGLLDIAVHPRGGAEPLVYMTLATGSDGQNRTTLVRGTLVGGQLKKIETLFQVKPDKSGGQHFGSRLQWLADGTLLMSVGDGGNPPLQIAGMLAREQAQNKGSHIGSVVRLDENGKAPANNPFVNQSGALPELWTIGHRNIQGLTFDPASGRVWANEHGPRGGDELNQLEAGLNYGWPKQTYGRDYRTGESIGARSVAGMVDPKVVWIPAAAPSGLAFYTGSHFPEWRGSLFSGGLMGTDLRRIALDGSGNVTQQERLTIGRRVRWVKQGPDGFLYVLTDEGNGHLLRIEPK